MGRLTGKHRRQNAVYWARTGEDKFNKPILTTPIPLKVRWEEKQIESLDANNQVIKTDVVVNTDRLLEIGSIVWKGSIRNVPDTPTSGLYKVVFRNVIPNLKNTETRYDVFLSRYTSTMPTVV